MSTLIERLRNLASYTEGNVQAMLREAAAELSKSIAPEAPRFVLQESMLRGPGDGPYGGLPFRAWYLIDNLYPAGKRKMAVFYNYDEAIHAAGMFNGAYTS